MAGVLEALLQKLRENSLANVDYSSGWPISMPATPNTPSLPPGMNPNRADYSSGWPTGVPFGMGGGPAPAAPGRVQSPLTAGAGMLDPTGAFTGGQPAPPPTPAPGLTQPMPPAQGLTPETAPPTAPPPPPGTGLPDLSGAPSLPGMPAISSQQPGTGVPDLRPPAPPPNLTGLPPVQMTGVDGPPGMPPVQQTGDDVAALPERVPLPRPRPAGIDVSAARRVGAPLDIRPPAQRAAPGTEPDSEAQKAEGPPSFGSLFGGIRPALEKVSNFLGDRSNTLLAIGAGFAGAPNIGQGISRAAAGAIPAQQADQKRTMTQNQLSQSYKALVGASVPPNLALAAIYNPDIMKSVVTNYLGDRKAEIKTVKTKDAFGNETERLVAVNPYDYTSKEITAQGGTGGNAGAPAPGGTVGGPGGFDPGRIDHTLVGEDYLKQFPNEFQASVKSYLAGKTLPTGRGNLANMIKMAAQKYGGDIGLPADDTAINSRKQFRTELGSTKSGAGMQVRGFQQAVSHLKELSDYAEKLDNSNGLGFADLAHGYNWLKNRTTKNADTSASLNNSAQTMAGEVGKLFSGAAGGGVHERESTAQRFNSVQSSAELAGAMESTIRLMEGGLRSLEQRRDSILGQDSGVEFIEDSTRKEIEHVQQVIKRLRGDAPAAATPAAPRQVAPGAYVWKDDQGLVPVQ